MHAHDIFIVKCSTQRTYRNNERIIKWNHAEEKHVFEMNLLMLCYALSRIEYFIVADNEKIFNQNEDGKLHEWTGI